MRDADIHALQYLSLWSFHRDIADHNNIYWETKLSFVQGKNFPGIDYKFFAFFSILKETTNAVITDPFSFFLPENA